MSHLLPKELVTMITSARASFIKSKIQESGMFGAITFYWQTLTIEILKNCAIEDALSTDKFIG